MKRTRNMSESSSPPIAKKQSHKVFFGYSPDQHKGNKKELINPPLEINDDYYWVRDESRSNTEVLD